jgi:transcription termination factor Rho
MNNQYDSMTLANLRELAKEKGLKNISAMKKSELAEALAKTASEERVPTEKTEPKAAEPRAAETKITELKAAEPRTAESKKTEPRITGPRITEPRISEPRASEPRGAEPRVTEQRLTEPRVTEPKIAEAADQNSSAGREERRPSANSNEVDQLDSGETKVGILEVLPDGYGFIRCDNYLPGENDVYVSPAQIRRFNLKTGDIVAGNTKIRNQNEKFSALLYVKSVNGFHPAEAQKRKRFEDLTPVFPNDRIHLETPGAGVSMRMVDLISPIGKGQRGMIVSQPKTGKTTLLKQIAKAVTRNHPDMKLIILLIDERPEEVTDIKESIEGKNVEVIYSTFDELPENHKRVSEMVIERAKRLVEHKQDVIILLDSITRLARAYNLTVQPSGRTLSGGLDPAALHMPKKFFGAARNMREGGSLTILATALVDTGSRMDDVVFEEFKGTGNMELVLDRSLSEKRIFPAIDLPRSSTRREDLLLTQSELEATYLMRKALGGMKSEEALERIIDMFLRTKTNVEFIEIIKKTKIVF